MTETQQQWHRIFTPPGPHKSTLLAIAGGSIVLAAGTATLTDLTSPSSPGFIAIALLGPTMAAVDVREHRLPDLLTLIWGIIAAIGMTLICAFTHNWTPLFSGAIAATIATVAFYTLSILTKAGMGLGDIKLSAVMGLVIGPLGAQTLLAAFAGAFICGAICAAIMRLRQPASAELAFGPFLLSATIITGLLTSV